MRKMYYLHLVNGREYYCSSMLNGGVPAIVYKDGNRVGKGKATALYEAYNENMRKLVELVEECEDDSCLLSEDEISKIFDRD